ncbi:hypothetical protein [Flavihumibacter fluvii]|uniref:hypothetical protein n=1 Tax=Flavihumibacter fluvii TaxID=2838157 RepID=UPI001BDF0E75|nr:hypothetical protein [Flavihumibacter fluvii]ULQ53988.1 hypothetical protein KJS93_06605 [Flavihumibacter fluvii]
MGIIPYNMVWGGRLESGTSANIFEILALLASVFMIGVVAVHTGYIKTGIGKNISRNIIWIMFVFFIVGTIGNLFSDNIIEKLIFTPITVILAISCYRLAMSKK